MDELSKLHIHLSFSQTNTHVHSHTRTGTRAHTYAHAFDGAHKGRGRGARALPLSRGRLWGGGAAVRSSVCLGFAHVFTCSLDKITDVGTVAVGHGVSAEGCPRLSGCSEVAPGGGDCVLSRHGVHVWTATWPPAHRAGKASRCPSFRY